MLVAWRSSISFTTNPSVASVIKSDRINAIKKQYDAFLEEDKKRKERNVYILEKLDKMRYCTAVVQVRKKPGIIDNADCYNSQKQSLGSLVSTIHQNTIPLKDESVLLKEISKKYILIPKLRSYYTDSYAQEIKQKNDDNSDWKSKYDILEKLKESEKENPAYIQKETYLHEPERDTSEQVLNAATTDQDGQILFDYKQDPVQQMQPEHQTPCENISYVENSNYMESQPIVYYENYDTQETDNTNLNSYPEKLEDEGDSKQIIQSSNMESISNATPITSIKDNIDNTISTQNNMGAYISDDNNSQFDNSQYTSELLSNNNEPYINQNVDQKMTINKDSYQTIDDGFPIQTIHPSDFVNEINNDIPPQLETKEKQQIEFSNEIIHPQNINPVDNSIQSEDIINSKQFVINDGNSVHNDNYVTVTNDNMEPTVDLIDPMIVDDTNTTERVFEEVNNEQYYTEQVEENSVYNQEGEENYTQEYAAPTENYQQEEYNTYYEGAQSEQVYGEVNENGEALQRYDQNYEQQYGVGYEGQQYEQQEYDQRYAQQGYDPQYVEQSQTEKLYSEEGMREQQHSDQEHYSDQGQAVLNYTDQNQVDQHYSEQAHEQQYYTEQGQEYVQPQQEVGQPQAMYENNTPQFVEQQLDNEEGYIEKQNENIETSKVEKPVLK